MSVQGSMGLIRMSDLLHAVGKDGLHGCQQEETCPRQFSTDFRFSTVIDLDRREEARTSEKRREQARRGEKRREEAREARKNS